MLLRPASIGCPNLRRQEQKIRDIRNGWRNKMGRGSLGDSRLELFPKWLATHSVPLEARTAGGVEAGSALRGSVIEGFRQNGRVEGKERVRCHPAFLPR